jgi:hypothetical protein
MVRFDESSAYRAIEILEVEAARLADEFPVLL